eukprot:CAMPEP_0175998556 /NCGR_PEP_ID=MMETSP0108-20121206/56804_1 /TAXON_ID=195067 ORGANISM="Goniomonas pacifica, Strain CCMP1869" /NCGR_SAMPLE_ID=MMETSP0108 /ASSEMBLY_ACC=CAM_ASM_000204 /LENGTH=122 /DNA_ID=CAMNT_0017330905 /DNA_START=79 /DNA_END=444 /DNA_ORIENTATION=-
MSMHPSEHKPDTNDLPELKELQPCLPVILCGDLNSVPWSRVICHLKTKFTSTYSAVTGSEPFCTTYKPEFKVVLDYILSAGPGLTPIAVRPVPKPEKKMTFRDCLPSETHPSDHLPLTTQFA